MSKIFKNFLATIVICLSVFIMLLSLTNNEHIITGLSDEVVAKSPGQVKKLFLKRKIVTAQTSEDFNSFIHTTPDYENKDKYVSEYLNRLDDLEARIIKADSKYIDILWSETEDLLSDFFAGDLLMSDQLSPKTNSSTASLEDKDKMVRRVEIPYGFYDYRIVSEKVASIYNIDIQYGLEKVSESGCSFNSSVEVFGVFCPNGENSIFISNSKNASSLYSSPVVVSAVKHELSHYRIHKICGNSSPKISKDLSEAVTSSFAVIYLGADRKYLNSVKDSSYTMSSETDRIARLIHDNKVCE